MSTTEGQNLDPWLDVTMNHREDVDLVARVMAVMLEFAPVKLNSQQIIAFWILANAYVRNEPMTISEMMVRFPHFTRAIRTGYATLVDDLKWLEAIPDTQDKRRKTLKLTEAGMEIVAKMMRA
jgi:hypothetical protein